MFKPLPAGTTGKYYDYSFVATSHTKYEGGAHQQLFEFESYGWSPDLDDHQKWSGLNQAKTYWWVTEPKDDESVFIGSQVNGYHCVVCYNFNKFAACNLTRDRHICFSCRVSYAWKYEDELI